MNPRPKKLPSELQSSVLRFSCTEAEEKEIRALAKAHGFNQYGTFVRLATLGKIQVDRSLIEKKKK